MQLLDERPPLALNDTPDTLQGALAILECNAVNTGLTDLVRMDRAFLLLGLHRAAEALAEAEHVLSAADPRLQITAHLCCALASRALNRPDLVVLHLRSIVGMYVVPLQAWVWLGDAYHAQGAWLDAVACYDEVLKPCPRNFRVHGRKLLALWRNACSAGRRIP